MRTRRLEVLFNFHRQSSLRRTPVSVERPNDLPVKAESGPLFLNVASVWLHWDQQLGYVLVDESKAYSRRRIQAERRLLSPHMDSQLILFLVPQFI